MDFGAYEQKFSFLYCDVHRCYLQWTDRDLRSVALISWHTNNTNIDIKDPQDPLKHLYDIDDGEESSGGLEVI